MLVAATAHKQTDSLSSMPSDITTFMCNSTEKFH